MNDLRLAARTLSKSRGLAAIAVLTFALGIGANTAIFSVIYAVLLRATPYPDADRLVRIHERGPLGPGMSVSPINFQDWKRASTSFERMSLFRTDEYTIGTVAIGNAIRSVDRGLPISDVHTMDDLVSQSLQYRRFSMLLLAVFAGVGLALALVGVYGVMAYSVAQRKHEIGIRMALGAARRDVTKLVLRNAVQQAGIGLALGFLLSLLISRWLARVVVGVSPTDPVTLSAVSALLAFAALAAGYIPARRATQVDPATALREE
jgi:hypothetical protein